MKHLNIIFSAVLVAAMISPAFAKPARLEYRFKAGQTDKYEVMAMTFITMVNHVKGSYKIPDELDPMELTVAQKVSKVNSAGVSSLMLSLQGMGSGTFMRPPPITRQTTVNKSGEVIGAKSYSKYDIYTESTSLLSMSGSDGMTIHLPNRPVSVGGTWTTKVNMPGTTGKYVVKSTLAGITRDSYKIIERYSGVIDTSTLARKGRHTVPGRKATTKLSGSATFILDIKSCKLLSANGSVVQTADITAPKTANLPARNLTETIRIDTTIKHTK